MMTDSNGNLSLLVDVRDVGPVNFRVILKPGRAILKSQLIYRDHKGPIP